MKRILVLAAMVVLGACLAVWGQSFNVYALRNGRGMTMEVTDFGARIVSLCVPDRDGKVEDVVCGYDSLVSYARYKQNYGATVGRYIGRILGARFVLDGKEYKLDAEGNGHYSHGVRPGFANSEWLLVSRSLDCITLKLVSPDGENGFPGELTMYVTMRLTEDNELRIDYEAVTTKPTVLNVSNHSFFNLSGDFRSTVMDERLVVDADSFALYDDKKCVTGKLSAVDGTPFDFRRERAIGERIDEENGQLKVTGGYDHTFRLNHGGDLNRVACRVYDPRSGRVMEVMTTEPGLHVYTGNGLKANSVGKGGVAYGRRSAVCFETMHFADSPNKPQWPSTVLRPGETFRSTTIFRFSACHETPRGLEPEECGYVPVAEGGKVYYEAYGEGTPVLLLHGHSLDRRMWRRQVEALASEYRVITPDMRGYGRSSRLREDLRSTHVDDMVTLMDSLGIGKAHVVGLSMGGFVASDMVAMYPERMLTCVLASGNLRNMKGPSEPLDSAEMAKQRAKMDDARAKGLECARMEWIEQLVAGGGSMAEGMREELTAIIKDWDMYQLMRYEPHLWYANEAKPRLEERGPEVPTLFLSGEKEGKKRAGMMRSLPRSEFVVIPDCGHMSNMERWEEFNGIVGEFLRVGR